jgi:immune inhibitor A
MRRINNVLVGGLLLATVAIAGSGRLYDAEAMPPHPGLKSQSPRKAAAVDRYEQLRAGFAARGIDQPGGGLAAGTQISGTFNMLAICVEFSDKPASVPVEDFDTLIFDQQSNSVWSYYDEVSYGSFSIVAVDLPSTLGWQTAPETYAYYGDSSYGMGSYPHNSQRLVEDLVDQIDSIVDFSIYDNDGDLTVDGLIIVHTGSGAELSGDMDDMWSHKWAITPRYRDGVYIRSYSIQPEYWLDPADRDITIGVYCHELGHVFGLPDLYDLDQSSSGIGRWSVMANGSWNGSLGASPAHFDAWCRTQLGFCTPIVVGEELSGANIPAVEDTGVVYRVWSDTDGGDEYFLVENRQKMGYDTYLPGSGLLIWHIDDSQTGNSNQWYPGHTSSGNQLVALEQADNLWDLEQHADYGDSGDPFPGSTGSIIFSAASEPSSAAYSGLQTYVTVTDISNSGPTMTCDFTVGLGTGVDDDESTSFALPTVYLTNHPNPFNPATVIEYSIDQPGEAHLVVYNILGRRVTTLLSGPQQPGVGLVRWDGTDDAGNQVASGVYLARLTTPEESTVRKMVLMR